MLTVCCVCNRTKQEEEWGMEYLGPASLEVSHGYCPDCFDELMEELSTTLPGWDMGLLLSDKNASAAFGQ